jgi:hypothetical protein
MIEVGGNEVVGRERIIGGREEIYLVLLGTINLF